MCKSKGCEWEDQRVSSLWLDSGTLHGSAAQNEYGLKIIIAARRPQITKSSRMAMQRPCEEFTGFEFSLAAAVC